MKKETKKEVTEEIYNQVYNNNHEIPELTLSFMGHSGSFELSSKGDTIIEAQTGMSFLLDKLSMLQERDKGSYGKGVSDSVREGDRIIH